MTGRRAARCFVVVTAAALATLSVGVRSPAARAQAPQRPNILFVLADDMTAARDGIHAEGQVAHRRSGVSFVNYFVNVSLCCPSRATMLRGQTAPAMYIPPGWNDWARS
jgi:N-acetylglucosamine-6-sulfatase